jgi:hypothetical protein
MHVSCLTVRQVFAEISLRSGNCTNPAQLRQFVPQPVVVGLFRDLRGIATATSTRRTYTLLFDWMVRELRVLHCFGYRRRKQLMCMARLHALSFYGPVALLQKHVSYAWRKLTSNCRLKVRSPVHTPS